MKKKTAFFAAVVARLTALRMLLSAVPASLARLLGAVRGRHESRPARRVAGHRGGFGPRALLRRLQRRLGRPTQGARRSGARPLRSSTRRTWAARAAVLRDLPLWPRIAASARQAGRKAWAALLKSGIVIGGGAIALGRLARRRIATSLTQWRQRRATRPQPRSALYAATAASAVRTHSTRALAAATARVQSSPVLAAAGERLKASPVLAAAGERLKATAAVAATRNLAAEMALIRSTLGGAWQTLIALPLFGRVTPALAFATSSLRALPHMAPPRPSKRTFFALAFVTVAAPYLAGADIYKYVDSRGHVHLTDKPDHPGYKRLVKTWKGWQQGKVSYRDLAKNRVKYSGTIAQAAKDHRVPPALLHAVITAESAYNPDAISTAGAVGLMQLMPDTATRYGVMNRRDPGANVMGGTRYLHDLLEMFDDNLVLALAAYNAGENAVIKCGRRIPPYKETETYVQRVLSYYNDYKRQM